MVELSFKRREDVETSASRSTSRGGRYKILLGPLRPFYSGAQRIGFSYVGDSVSPPRDRRGRANLWLERDRILGAFVNSRGDYYVVYATDNIDYYRPASAKLPPDAKPTDEISFTKVREEYLDPDFAECYDNPACEEVRRIEEKVVAWRGSIYTKRDFIEDDSFTLSRIYTNLRAKYGEFVDVGKGAWCEIIGEELEEISFEGFFLRVVFGVALESPDPELMKGHYEVVAAGVFIEETSWFGSFSLVAAKWRNYYVVKSEEKFIEAIRRYAANVRRVVGSYRIEINPMLTKVFGERLIEEALAELAKK